MGSIGEEAKEISSTIPVVDFSKYLNSSSKEEQLVVAKELTDACRAVGFVYIINHGLPQELLTQAFDTDKRLFDLSHKEKMQAPHPDGPEVHRGYSHPGLEKVSQYSGYDKNVQEEIRKVEDCKESYEIGSDENVQQPNVWLPEQTLPGFREFTTEFYWECNKVARSILGAMALGIGLEDPGHLTKFFSGHNNQLRLLHYPPLPAADVENNVKARMPAHTDWSAITLLFQDSIFDPQIVIGKELQSFRAPACLEHSPEQMACSKTLGLIIHLLDEDVCLPKIVADCGGLQVEDPYTPDNYVPAAPIPGACVMNVGDLLMRWSNDYLKSTRHRVTLPPLSDRFQGQERMTQARRSIVYFVSPDPDSVIECLPPCIDANHPVKYDPVTQKAYSAMKSQVQYRKSKSSSHA